MLSGEHFTSYFLDALPQLGVGLAEKYQTPSARWPRDRAQRAARSAQLGEHIVAGLIERNSGRPCPTRWSRTTASSPSKTSSTRPWRLPSCRWCSNCTTPPLITLGQSYEFSIAMGEVLSSYQGWSGWRSSAAGGCPTSSRSRGSATSTRTSSAGSSRSWQADCGRAARPAQRRAHGGRQRHREVRAWVALAAPCGARDEAPSYEAIYEWIIGIAVVTWMLT